MTTGTLRRCLITLAVSAATLAPVWTVAATAHTISLVEHSQRTLTVADEPERIAVADPTTADVQILSGINGRPSNILLVAHKPGDTEVQIWTAGQNAPITWRVHVTSGVQQALSAAGLAPQAQITRAGEQSILTGESDSLLAHRNAMSATGNPQQVIDASTISSSSMVQVAVQVAELSRNVMKDVGIDWSGTGSSHWSADMALIPSALSGSGFAVNYLSHNFNAKLKLLENNGMARILAQPTLVAMSGQSASFLAGGEIPVPQSGGLGTQTILYKPFGIGLTVSPTVLSPNRISLKVSPEASEIDYANGIPITNGDDVTLMPAFRTRRADTTVELGDGESFVISGLVSRQTMANVSKVPFLGDLPIIGTFFRNVSYTQQERELVIIVTPHLVKPIAKGAPLSLPGERQEARDSTGNAWGYYLVGPGGDQQMPGFSH